MDGQPDCLEYASKEGHILVTYVTRDAQDAGRCWGIHCSFSTPGRIGSYAVEQSAPIEC